MQSLNMGILEEILNENLGLAVILSEPLLRIPGRLLHRFENLFIAGNKTRPKRLGSHVLSVGIRKNVDLFFFALKLDEF